MESLHRLGHTALDFKEERLDFQEFNHFNGCFCVRLSLQASKTHSNRISRNALDSETFLKSVFDVWIEIPLQLLSVLQRHKPETIVSPLRIQWFDDFGFLDSNKFEPFFNFVVLEQSLIDFSGFCMFDPVSRNFPQILVFECSLLHLFLLLLDYVPLDQQELSVFVLFGRQSLLVDLRLNLSKLLHEFAFRSVSCLHHLNVAVHKALIGFLWGSWRVTIYLLLNWLLLLHFALFPEYFVFEPRLQCEHAPR